MTTQIPSLPTILSDPRYAGYANFLSQINANWEPHDGQRLAGEAIFVHGARRLFIECGRKWGKSDFATDVSWRLGNMIQGGQGYYFAATLKAARELMWANDRMEGHGPKEYIKSINQSDMRITWTSDTFLKIEGADNFAQAKGFNPDFVILDEFADYPEPFWRAMSPNFASKDAWVIIISSPPWELESEPGVPVQFIKIADLWDKYQKIAESKGKRSRYVYINQPTSANPHIPKAWLRQERQELIDMGEEDQWQREYEAKRVIGGGKRVIGTYDRDKHMVDHEWLMENRIRGREEELEWANVADPAAASVFANLIIAIDPYSKEVYFLDELYEKQEDETTEHIIWPKLKAQEDDVYPLDINADPERFLHVYDEAETWWRVGVNNEYGIAYTPTEKGKNSREFGITLLRSIFRYNKAYVSDRCKWLGWELENWRKDNKGRIPKINDHLVDCSRYGLHALDYFLLVEEREKKPILTPREKIHAIHSATIDREVRETAEELYGDGFYPSSDNLDEENYA